MEADQNGFEWLIQQWSETIGVNAIKSASSHGVPVLRNIGINRWAGKKFISKPKIPTPVIAHDDNREVYLQIQRMCKKASSKQEYLKEISRIDGKTLNISIHWARENITANTHDSSNESFKETGIDVNVEQFGKIC